jgi:hypothetical protein
MQELATDKQDRAGISFRFLHAKDLRNEKRERRETERDHNLRRRRVLIRVESETTGRQISATNERELGLGRRIITPIGRQQL